MLGCKAKLIDPVGRGAKGKAVRPAGSGDVKGWRRCHRSSVIRSPT